MTNESQNPNEKSNRQPSFDLEERTAEFGETVIRFAKAVPKNTVTLPLIDQYIRSGTSVAANYCEADDAVSKKDFKNKIGTCRKESRETKLWLRMIAAAEPELKIEARKLWQEAKELHLIFCRNLEENMKQDFLCDSRSVIDSSLVLNH